MPKKSNHPLKEKKEGNLSTLLETLPDNPGIYRFIDSKGEILYIGKAKNLKKRVRTYFSKNKGHSARILVLIKKTRDIHFTVTDSETEALLLENNLIKENQPRYNINLKDGKTYPYICIKNERFPRVFPTRKKIQDGSSYYGPYASIKAMNTLLELIRQNFKLRTCNYTLSKENIEAGKFKICLEYQIGNCGGPCENKVSLSNYNQNIENIRKLLNGNLSPLILDLTHEMKSAAEAYDYEKAEQLKQGIEKISLYKRKSTIFSESIGRLEVFTLDNIGEISVVNHFKILKGRIIQTHSWETRKSSDQEASEILTAAISKQQAEDEEFSNLVITNISIDQEELGDGIEIFIPQRGEKRKLIELSLKNCRVLLEEKVLRQNLKKGDPGKGLMDQMKQDLRLPAPPLHIECIDNSNLQGTNPVASLVVFKKGKPSKKDYRHYKIKTVSGPDDFKSMAEVVTRRYSRLLEENQALPDLLIVDGGKGQLSSAAEALDKIGLLRKIPIIGIAKKLEELYFLNDPIPLHLDKRGVTLRVIQQLRNEAHRFAISFHRNLRSKAGTPSKLLNIEGIGEKTSLKLLAHFKSLKKLKEASQNEITRVAGKSVAKLIQEGINDGKI